MDGIKYKTFVYEVMNCCSRACFAVILCLGSVSNSLWIRSLQLWNIIRSTHSLSMKWRVCAPNNFIKSDIHEIITYYCNRFIVFNYCFLFVKRIYKFQNLIKILNTFISIKIHETDLAYIQCSQPPRAAQF
jgi:hypothetical protein